MRKLRALEDVLVRVESVLAVVLVLTMLLLAAYNVVYRNVLVPLQNHWAHSGPPVEVTAAKTDAPQPDAPPSEAKPGPETAPLDSAPSRGADDFGGFGGLGDDDGDVEGKAASPPAAKPAADDFGGFGGDLDDEDDEDDDAPTPAPAPAPAPESKAAPAKPAADDFGGFGGGLGDEAPAAPEPPAPVAVAEPAKAAGDDFGGFGGFGGGLGDEGSEATLPAKAGEAKADATPKADLDEGEDDHGEDDLGDDDQFANLAEIDAAAKTSADAIPKGGPPPTGSFAAWAVTFIDDIKLDWIDIFLRQLVIIVAFFGAMLATQRGKHINIDALSKVLPPGVRRVVGVLLPLTAVAVCLVLARAGWDLVQISRAFPKDLLPSVPEWTLQLMFPVGFGLLAVHFAIRVLEAALVPPEPQPPPVAAAAKSALVGADLDDGATPSRTRGGQG
jgi:TRAP-type C4-dicarboxylate transport system permease small subunit